MSTFGDSFFGSFVSFFGVDSTQSFHLFIKPKKTIISSSSNFEFIVDLGVWLITLNCTLPNLLGAWKLTVPKYLLILDTVKIVGFRITFQLSKKPRTINLKDTYCEQALQLRCDHCLRRLCVNCSRYDRYLFSPIIHVSFYSLFLMVYSSRKIVYKRKISREIDD